MADLEILEGSGESEGVAKAARAHIGGEKTDNAGLFTSSLGQDTARSGNLQCSSGNAESATSNPHKKS
ncbi:hypothetical protein V1264_008856 [Littorina saxatilis]|uniref:Uncharacterized protein n=1 Tax=Littorina saxatilis TaxID=31220 RepID=A0AAN9G223_9CAEN